MSWNELKVSRPRVECRRTEKTSGFNTTVAWGHSLSSATPQWLVLGTLRRFVLAWYNHLSSGIVS